MNHTHLSKASDSVLFAAQELRAANAGASALEHLLLLPLIERATRLQQDIAVLHNAMQPPVSRIGALTDVSVDNCEFTIRTSNCLRGTGITTVGQLCAQSEATLLSLRNFGRKSLREVKDWLSDRDLCLSQLTTAEAMRNVGIITDCTKLREGFEAPQ